MKIIRKDWKIKFQLLTIQEFDDCQIMIELYNFEIYDIEFTIPYTQG
jgi:hypothetical protein